VSSDDEIFQAEASFGGPTDGSDVVSPFGPEPAVGMRYFHMVRYVFEHPQWGMTLLLGTVCQFIPLIGNILLIGYQYEIVAALQKGAPQYPEFNFDRFLPYLYRGIWPFLVNLIVSMVLMPVAALTALGLAFAADAFDLDDGPKILIIVVPAVGLLLLVLLFMALFVTPMFLGAGLTQTITWGFRPRFVLGFVRRVWPEILLGTVFLMLVGMALMALGMLLCFVGAYPAVTLLMLAQAHFHFQLYRLYLARGGEALPVVMPAPLKTPPALA
jgi:hypothetical protein